MKAGNVTYLSRNDLPDTIGLFPLESVLILPGAYLSLNVFEQRYLSLVNDALKGERIIGILQIKPGHEGEETPPLYQTGCMARIIGYNETGDNRVIISLQGICRFSLINAVEGDKPYRRYRVEPWLEDFIDETDLSDEKRTELMEAFSDLFDAHNLDTDWQHAVEAAAPLLVNALSVVAPFTAAEKQALLEVPSTTERVETLIALAERSILTQDGFKAKDLQ